MSKLIVSRCDTAEILESAEATLNDVAAFISLLIVTDFLSAIGFAPDDGLDASLLEESPDRIGIIAFVRYEFFNAGDEADAFFGHHTIGGIAGREDERPRPAEFVDDRMDLAVTAAFRKPDRLKFRPPFPPLAQRWAFTWLLSNAACSGGSQGPATHSNIFCQMSLSLQRAKRL